MSKDQQMARSVSNFDRAQRPRIRERFSGCRRAVRGRKMRLCGFSLLELMIVITIMMILLAVAVPLYQRHIIQAREAVLRENVQQLDKLIQEYTENNQKAPQALDDLVTAGYLHEIPKDPMTGQADWDTIPEDPMQAADPEQPGIVGVHSHANGNFLDGQPYNSV